MRELISKDRFGLGWRPELAAAILSNLDQIDVVEVILEDYFNAPIKKLQSLVTLSKQVDVEYHGVSLGLASVQLIEQNLLEKLARTLGYLEVESWSEHLAFVRSGGIEIGHLAAPPRNEATIQGAYNNLRRIKNVVGIVPSLENIATLIDPPGSKMSEPQWIEEILSLSQAPLLLDLHNLYANALNFGFNPENYLFQFPLHRVRTVHLSGGRWIKEPTSCSKAPGKMRLLDDHVHDVPDPVFELLELFAANFSQPITVIIERDGEFPESQKLLAQVQRARRAVTAGRNLRTRKGKLHERANF